MLKWPDAATVARALQTWAEAQARVHPELLAVGYLGSYARGDWGVGSDVDIVIVVQASERDFVERARDWDVTGLPVPADLLIYTPEEWRRLGGQGRFGRALREETVWVRGAPPA